MNPILIFALVVALYLANSIKILNEYERGVIFRLGKLLPRPKGPGVILVFAPIDRMVRVGLRTIVMDVPPQDIITRDNVSVTVNAVLYFRVMDPTKAIVEVESFNYATSQLAQTTLRSVLICSRNAIGSTRTCSACSISRQIRGGSRLRRSRSSMWISRRTCSAPWPDRPKPSVRSVRRSSMRRANSTPRSASRRRPTS